MKSRVYYLTVKGTQWRVIVSVRNWKSSLESFRLVKIVFSQIRREEWIDRGKNLRISIGKILHSSKGGEREFCSILLDRYWFEFKKKKREREREKKENKRTRGLILHKWIDTRKTSNEVFIASSTYVHLSYRIGEICNKSAGDDLSPGFWLKIFFNHPWRSYKNMEYLFAPRPWHCVPVTGLHLNLIWQMPMWN